MLNREITGRFWLLSLFLLAISLTLVGCDINSPAITTPTVERTPKGPGAANLTATALTTPVATTCPAYNTAPASTNGWQTYKDTRFPFQFAIPIGWKAGSFTDGSGIDYITAVLPGTSTLPFEHVSAAPEKFEVSVALSGPVFNPASDPDWKAESTPITISGMKTTLYDRTSPDCGETDRIAVANFGQHQFTFDMGVYALGKAQQDIALFLGIVHSFVYSG